MKIAYDRDPVWIDDLSFDASSMATGLPSDHYGDGLSTGCIDSAYAISVAPSRQKCESIRIKIYDAGTTPGEKLELTGISFVYGVKSGAQPSTSNRKQ